MRVECTRCGTFDITGSALAANAWIAGKADEKTRRAKVSYALRGMQKDNDVPLLTTTLRDQILENTKLPTPTELVENLLLAFGDDLSENPGAQSKFAHDDFAKLIAQIGARDILDVHYAASQLEELGLANKSAGAGFVMGRLSYTGWLKYNELKRSVSDSRLAFMAMPFGNEKLDRVFLEFFVPAVKHTGFDLYRIDQSPPAGSIDNRLRVEIRRSRFLIAELTEDNSGAYWEAGFAEGLGRPVIYTCEEGHRTHFDTRQSLTVFWEEDQLEDAARRLKDTIRATLPEEAVLTEQSND